MQHAHTGSNAPTYLLLTGTTLLFAGAFHAAKLGIGLTTPVALLFWRFFFAILVLFPFMMRQPKEKRIVAKKDYALLLSIGLTGMLFYHLLFFKSLEDTSPVNAAVIGSFTPLVTSVAAAFWGKEPLGIKRFGALLMALFGVLLTLAAGNWDALLELRFNRGDLVMLLSVFFLAAYNVLSKNASATYTPLTTLFYAMVVAFVTITPFFLWERPWATFDWTSLPLWGSILYMSVAATSMGYLFFQMGIQRVGVSHTVPFLNLVPIYSILLSLLFHGFASISPVQVASSLIIVSGVYLNSRL